MQDFYDISMLHQMQTSDLTSLILFVTEMSTSLLLIAAVQSCSFAVFLHFFQAKTHHVFNRQVSSEVCLNMDS